RDRNVTGFRRVLFRSNVALHLIHPLGFSTDDKMLKRAGLDYWEHVNVIEHESMAQLYNAYKEATYYFIENFGTNYYTEPDYSNPDEEIFFVFSKETTGIPKSVIEEKQAQCLRIPMTDNIRSYNLSNTAALVIFEALRQQHFTNLK